VTEKEKREKVRERRKKEQNVKKNKKA